MLILADTNILLRLVERRHPQHSTAAEALEILRTRGHRLAIVPQIVYEYWVVATRPLEVNGLGMGAADAKSELDGLWPSFKLLRDERTIFEVWRQLVLDHEVTGKSAHDARLVAAMFRHGVSQLLTFNGRDFANYSQIAVIEPQHAGLLPIES